MLIFRQLYDATSSTYTYLLADRAGGKAVLIDPVFEQYARDAALVEELGLKLVATLDTHVHADHVTGAWLLREKFGSQIALSAASGAEGADRYLADGDMVAFGSRHLASLATPGHTSGCTTYVLDDGSMAFTGDCLLIRGCGRTDFQQGDAAQMYRSVHERIFTLADDCLLYPGHDYRGSTVTTVGEEKAHNPRLNEDVGLEDFRGYMDNLGLPHPKLIDIALPANLVCGKPPAGTAPGKEPDWAPLIRTYAGFWEVQPAWLEEHARQVQLVDVREADEFEGALGHIAGARLIPLSHLRERLAELDKTRPVVTVCRSGARSANAAQVLEKEGFGKVANLAGGLLRWHAHHFPVVDRHA